MAVKTFKIQQTSHAQMYMSKSPPACSVPPPVDYYSTPSGLPPPPVEYHLPTEQACTYSPLDSSPYLVTSGAEKSPMNSLSPSSLPRHFSPPLTQFECLDRDFSPPLTQFGSSASDNFPSFSSSYDDDSSKLLEDDSDDSTHPRPPIKPKSSIKTNRGGSKSKKAALDEKVYPITEVFNPLFLEEQRKKSVSRANFATILVRNFFTREARISSNVGGKRGKKQLNKDMLAAIKVVTFRMWPLSSAENEKSAWKQYRKAIDGSGRQLYHARNAPKET